MTVCCSINTNLNNGCFPLKGKDGLLPTPQWKAIVHVKDPRENARNDITYPRVLSVEKGRIDSKDGRCFLIDKSVQFNDRIVVNAAYKNSFLEYSVKTEGCLVRSKSCPDVTASVASTQRIPLITTYMIRNIPTRFTSLTFTRLLDEYGFGKTFDFFYLPMDFRSGKNMGYAFINFREPRVGLDFVYKFHSRKLPVSTSKKVIEVYPSRRQGLSENIALFRTSDLLNSVSLPHYKPLIANECGMLVPLCDNNFPNTTY